MAEFNPEVPSPEPKNFGGYSQGISNNRTFETLFSGAANVLDKGVNALDKNIQQNLYEDASKEVEKVRTLFGVDAAAAAASDVPSAVTAGIAQMEKIKDAYKAGVIRESYYYGQLQNITKGMKSKYPGYEQHVDAAIQDITGVTPANSIVAALRREAEADMEKMGDFEKMRQSWINANQDDLSIVAPDYIANPDAYDFTEVQLRVGQYQAEIKGLDVQKKQLELRLAQGNATEEEALKIASKEAGMFTHTVMNGMVSANGMTYPKFVEKLNEFSKPGSRISPEELEGIKQMGLSLRNAVLQRLNGMFANPINEEGDSLGSLIPDNAKKNGIIEAALRPIDDMIAAITNGDYGIAAADAAVIKSIVDSEKRSFYEKNQLPVKLQVLKDTLGETGFGVAMTATMDEWSTTINNYIKGDVLSGGTVTDSVTTAMAEGGEINPKAYEQAIDEVLNWIKNPTTAELPTQAVNGLFGPGNEQFLSLFGKDEQVAIYNKLVNPAVSKAVKTNAQEGDWINYKRWAYNNFHAVFKQSADDVNIAIQNRKWLDLKWNPEEGQFLVGSFPASRAQGASGQVGDFNLADVAERQLTKTALKNITKINAALSSVKSVIELDGGDITEQMDLLVQGIMGIDPDAKKVGPFFDNMQKAIKEWLEIDNVPANSTGGPDERAQDPKKLSETMTPETGDLIKSAAAELGVDALDLATLIGYETIGTYDHNIWGGRGGNYLGWIQFGEEERQKYGVSEGMDPIAHKGAMVSYFKDRGLEPGMGLLDMYSTVNAGRPGLYGASDKKGYTVQRHVDEMNTHWRDRAKLQFGL